MTQPLATAHVDAELDWDNIDEDLVRRLEKSTKIATRAAQKNFDALERSAQKTFERIGTGYAAQMTRMRRDTRVAVIAMRNELGKLSQAIDIRINLPTAAIKQAHRDVQAYLTAHPLSVKITANAAAMTAARTAMQAALDAHPLNARINVTAGSMTAARTAMQTWLDAHPLNVNMGASSTLVAVKQARRDLQTWLTANPLTVALKVDATTSLAALRATHAQMQAWLRAHPLEVPVNPNGNNGHGGAGGGLGGKLSKMFKGIMSSAGGAIGAVAKWTSILGAATVGAAGALPAVAALGAALAAVGAAAGGAAVAGMATMGVVMASLKVATSGMGDALKYAFDPENVEKYNEALAKLSPQAQSTVKAIKGLGDEFTRSGAKAAVQDRLFAGLGTQMQGLSRYIPAVKTAMVQVAAGFNTGAREALGFVNSAFGMAKVRSLLDSTSTMGSRLGESLGRLAPALLSIATSAARVFAPLTSGLAGADGAVQKFADRVKFASVEGGQMDQFFKNAIDVAKQFGAVLSGVGSILGGVFSAAKAASGGNGFAAITDKLAIIGDWVNSATGQNALTTFFQSMQTAVAAVLPIVTQLATIIGTTVAPAIASLLTTIGPVLQSLTPMLGSLVGSILNVVGPLIGSLVTALGPVINTIGGVLTQVFAALQPAVEPLGRLFQALGPIISQVAIALGQGLTTALGILVPIFNTVVNLLTKLAPLFFGLMEMLTPLVPLIVKVAAVAGGIFLLVKAFQMVQKVIQAVQLAWAVLSLVFSASPIGLIVVAVVALAAALWAFFTKTETGRKLWDKIWNGIKTAVSAAWNWMKPVFEAIKNAFGVVVEWFKSTAVPWFQSVWQSISGVVGKAVGWIRDNWRLVISVIGGPIGVVVALVTKYWDQIKSVIAFAWNNVIKPIFSALATAFRAVGTVVGWLWNNVVSPAFKGIGAVISWVWNSILKPAFDGWVLIFRNVIGPVISWLWNNVIAPAFKGIGAVISWAWNNIIKPAWDGFKLGLSLLGEVVMWLWNNVITPAWNAIGAVISFAWNNIIKPIWDGFIKAITWVGEKVMWFWNNVITPAWDGIKTAISTAWGFIEPIWERFKRGLGVIGDKMGDLKDKLVGAWDAIKSAVSGVFDKVSDFFGLIEKGWSKISGFVGKIFGFSGGSTVTPNGPGAQAHRDGGPIQAFAEGGSPRRARAKVSGRGGPRADKILSWLSNGEFVEPAKAVNSKTLPWLEAIRRGWEPPSSGLVPAFAGGGSVNGREPYGLPVGTNTGGYGSSGSVFPQWVHDIEQKFGVKASTYPGHQEGSGKNKGIDWSGPVDKMQAFAEYLLSIKGELEQVIWMNPNTGEQIGVFDGQRVGPGTSQPGYYRDDWADHTNHVHTRQSYSFGGASSTGGPGIDSPGGNTGGGLTTGGSSGTPIGSGLGSSSSSSSGSGSAQWGNSGGGSRFNSVGQARRGGLTPVWVENWPATMGGGGGGGSLTTGGGDTSGGAALTTGGGGKTASTVDTIPLKKNPDGTWTSTDPEWAKLINRESGGKADIVQGITDANSGGNEASGLFQIALGTWKANGGTKYAPTAGEATPEQQAEIAARIFNKSGGSPWGSGKGQNFGRENEDALRAGIQRKGATTDQPLTPAGTGGGTGSGSGGGTVTGSKLTTLTNRVEKLTRDIEAAKDDVRTKTQRRDEIKGDPKSKPSQISAAENALTKATNRVTTLESDLTAAQQKVDEANRKTTDNTGGGQKTTTDVEFTIGGGTLSSQVGGYANTATTMGIDNYLKDNPGLLGDFDNTKAQTSLGTRAGAVAGTALSGQLSSALGIFGLDAQPPILDAVGQYITDNKGGGGAGAGEQVTQKNLIDLVKAAFEAGSVQVIMQGGNGDEVARKVDAARQRKMRRYVK